jgi:hypothetical protein
MNVFLLRQVNRWTAAVVNKGPNHASSMVLGQKYVFFSFVFSILTIFFCCYIYRFTAGGDEKEYVQYAIFFLSDARVRKRERTRICHAKRWPTRTSVSHPQVIRNSRLCQQRHVLLSFQGFVLQSDYAIPICLHLIVRRSYFSQRTLSVIWRSAPRPTGSWPALSFD